MQLGEEEVLDQADVALDDIHGDWLRRVECLDEVGARDTRRLSLHLVLVANTRLQQVEWH